MPGTAAAAGIVVPALQPGDAGRVVRFEGRALGSTLVLHLRLRDAGLEPGPGDRGASLAWDRVRDEFDGVDRALSRFREDSELTALNRLAGSGRVVRVSWRLRTMLAAAHRASRITGGRFDASVLADLERLGERGAALDPPGNAPGDGTSGPDPDQPGRASLVRAPAVPLDSGGIGKGLALRWAAAAALETLPDGTGLLLEAGGDIVSAGAAPAGGWAVGIEDPASPGPDAEPLVVVNLERGALATSSVRVRNWIAPDGRRAHHILDPRTGAPAATGLIAVTVAGADPGWSEVWSKALFLAGRYAIGDEARARGIAAWWVASDGRLGMTPAARASSAWIDEARVG